jgi:hypothetical protein
MSQELACPGCIINGDPVNLAVGIVALVFLNEPGVRRYFRR